MIGPLKCRLQSNAVWTTK